MTGVRAWIERAILRWDALVCAANDEPVQHPPGCTCPRCDATVPDAPCEHPASLRYALDRWYCGSCGDPCEPPAVPPDTRQRPACTCDAIDADNGPCIGCAIRASVIGRIDD